MSVLKMREEAIRIFQENFLYEQVDGRIRIEIDPESVLVLSPGRYISIMRNKTLGLLFYKLGFIESLGSGIPMVMDTYKNSVSRVQLLEQTDLSKYRFQKVLNDLLEKGLIRKSENSRATRYFI